MQEPEAEVREYDPALAEAVREGDADDEVSIIARVSDEMPLPAGVQVITRFGDVVTLRVRLSQIEELAAHEAVMAMEASRSLGPTRDVDAADADAESGGAIPALPPGAPDLAEEDGYSRRPTGVAATGRGVVVGVLDWGVDMAHPAFRLDDGRTRLLALWDQRGRSGSGAGNRWGYGRILYPEEINRALRQQDPYAQLGYHPADADAGSSGSHGTHVLDIAAGNGRGGGMKGVAPDAELVFVHLARTTPALSRGNLGDSVTVLEALDFVFTIAGRRPCVVNMSVGAHGGPHDGTTLVEQGIDRAVWLENGRAVINSAGNYFAGGAHTQGRLRQGEEATVRFEVPAADPTESEVELWYPGSDRFSATVIAPDGTELASLVPGGQSALVVDGQAAGHLYHIRHPLNREHHIDLFLKPRAPGGVWQLRLRGVSVQDGRYHAWIERETGPRPRFVAPRAVRTSTTGTLCNGRLSITVGAYDPRSRSRRMGSFSSAGPTRDGRVKPEIVAPGVRIRAARSTPRGEPPGARYTYKGGTSMAAPHVTGALAVMFEAADRRLEIADTRVLLLASADRFGFESPAAGRDVHRLGSGYLDVAAAERAVRQWVRRDSEGETAMDIAEWEPPLELADAREFLPEIDEIADDASDAVAESTPPEQETSAAPPDKDWAAADASEAQLETVWIRGDEAEAGEAREDGTGLQDAPRWRADDGSDDTEVAAADEVAGEAGTGEDGFVARSRQTGRCAESDWAAAVLVESAPASPSLREALWAEASAEGLPESAVALHERAFSHLGIPATDTLVPLAESGGPLMEPVQPGDLLIRVAPGQGIFHSAVIVSEQAESRAALLGRGVAVEAGGPGAYVEVIEVAPGSSAPHSYGRRLTDSSGMVPYNQSVVRAAVLLAPTSGATLEPEAEWSDAPEQVIAGVDWCQMRQTIAATARAEEARWTQPKGTKFLESHPSRLPILAQYWSAVPGFGTQAAAQQAAQNSANNVAGFEWSAAFICFVLHTAGVRRAHGFDFAGRHMNYIVGALRNRERSDQNRPFWLVDGVEVQREATAEPGDLLCFNRSVNGVMTNHSYASLRNRFWLGGNQNTPPFGSSHCSIVVGSGVAGTQRFIERIGGNEAGSVRLQRVPVDQFGGIPNPQAQNIFGMIKLIGC